MIASAWNKLWDFMVGLPPWAKGTAGVLIAIGVMGALGGGFSLTVGGRGPQVQSMDVDADSDAYMDAPDYFGDDDSADDDDDSAPGPAGDDDSASLFPLPSIPLRL